MSATLTETVRHYDDNTPCNLTYGYKKSELDAAFSAVANAENWKLPVDAKIKADDLSVTAAAIAFHTGAFPTVESHGEWLNAEGKLIWLVRVTAPGYYETIGA